MIAAGLDLSLTSTGWAIWGGHVGRIRTDLAATRHMKGIRRRRFISNMTRYATNTDRRHEPALIVIEKSFTNSVNAKTGIELAMLHAVVLDTLEGDDHAIVYVTPSTAKKHLAGSGKADKDQMIAAAQACGYQGNQTDEADAWGLALLGHHLLGGTDFLTPHRASCLAAVEWLVPLPEVARVDADEPNRTKEQT